MRILDLDTAPFHALDYRSAKRGGGSERAVCEMFAGVVDVLPDHVDALVITGDLQGVVGFGAATRLLGAELAIELASLSLDGALPPLERVGCIIAGDMYSAPAADERGASGDVRAVWSALGASLAFVAGVAGNHDSFGTRHERAVLAAMPGVHLLDGDVVELGGAQVGGVSGIVGDPKRVQRKELDTFLALTRAVLTAEADLLVLHEGPSGGDGQRGNATVRDAIIDAASAPVLVACGHVHWRAPLADISALVQVLNVDGRVVVLRGATPARAPSR
ncbi:MAG TPA: metallophosphoesterase [Myxococcota bacterium]|jgi:Icc-related predicted phosphoesterase